MLRYPHIRPPLFTRVLHKSMSSAQSVPWKTNYKDNQ